MMIEKKQVEKREHNQTYVWLDAGCFHYEAAAFTTRDTCKNICNRERDRYRGTTVFVFKLLYDHTKRHHVKSAPLTFTVARLIRLRCTLSLYRYGRESELLSTSLVKRKRVLSTGKYVVFCAAFKAKFWEKTKYLYFLFI